MNNIRSCKWFVCFLLLFSFGATIGPTPKPTFSKLKFPYKKQGLSDYEAAAHLVNRFTFGASPGQIDEVVKMGLENWFEKQLHADLPDDVLNEKLASYQYLHLSNAEALATFPKFPKLVRMAIKEGELDKDSVKTMDKSVLKDKIATYRDQKKLHQENQLIREFVNQKILKACYSNNQLQEILTSFWFNHFNVSLSKPQVIHFAPAYERDVIRPNVLGKFSTLLTATAKSPAMLVYLDNYSSCGETENLQNPETGTRARKFLEQNNMTTDTGQSSLLEKNKERRSNKGLNENYAREVMELHTLGVDGGYNQQDVTNAAKVLTGWTIYPFDEEYAGPYKKLIETVGEEQLTKRGFVREGDFFFTMNRHDIKEKKVLGRIFPENGGYQEGMDLLNMLAHQKATAQFISKKIATYFVADQPPASLINKMTSTFLQNDGDIKELIITMVNAPEFWSKASVRQKTKSPFELVVSAIRALDADVVAPFQVFKRMESMGQKIYFYQAPTGFPDRSDYWISTGALLNRMNFGIDIAAQQMSGVKVDLLKINQGHEPENASAALQTYLSLLMPGRNMDATIKRLQPLLSNPAFEKKLKEAADQQATVSGMGKNDANDMDVMDAPMSKVRAERNMLAQVVGIIIGSPEFQRK